MIISNVCVKAQELSRLCRFQYTFSVVTQQWRLWDVIWDSKISEREILVITTYNARYVPAEQNEIRYGLISRGCQASWDLAVYRVVASRVKCGQYWWPREVSAAAAPKDCAGCCCSRVDLARTSVGRTVDASGRLV